MTTTQRATEQETERAIFGSGLHIYPWWRSLVASFRYATTFPYAAPSGWKWEITARDAEDDEHHAVIDHAAIIQAMRKIRDGAVEASASCQRECRTFLKDAEEADFDAVSADEVLQVAVLGEIVFG